jgi:hypothetical protein
MATANVTALMMEAVHTHETSVSFNVTTRRYIPEDFKVCPRPPTLYFYIIPHYK